MRRERNSGRKSTPPSPRARGRGRRRPRLRTPYLSRFPKPRCLSSNSHALPASYSRAITGEVSPRGSNGWGKLVVIGSSFKIGRISGIDVKVHWTFFLLLLFFGYLGFRDSQSMVGTLVTILLVIAL